MASEASICNLALSHLGAYTISSLNDPTQEARKCKLYYEVARDYVLRDFSWGFAEKRAALALNGDTPTGYDYSYQYPVDCLKAREIYNDISGSEPLDFTVNSAENLTDKAILTDVEEAILIYTAKVTVPDVFDASFIMMLSYYLASLLAIPLTKSQATQQVMLQVYSAYKSRSETASAQENVDTSEVDNAFLKARD